jgi:hypothetical protein
MKYQLVVTVHTGEDKPWDTMPYRAMGEDSISTIRVLQEVSRLLGRAIRYARMTEDQLAEGLDPYRFSGGYIHPQQ